MAVLGIAWAGGGRVATVETKVKINCGDIKENCSEIKQLATADHEAELRQLGIAQQYKNISLHMELQTEQNKLAVEDRKELGRAIVEIEKQISKWEPINGQN